MNEKREKNVKEQKKSHIEQNEQIELFTLLSFYGLDDMQRMYRVKERSKKSRHRDGEGEKRTSEKR